MIEQSVIDAPRAPPRTSEIPRASASIGQADFLRLLQFKQSGVRPLVRPRLPAGRTLTGSRSALALLGVELQRKQKQQRDSKLYC